MKTRNKSLIVIGAILLVVALVILLVGGILAGWDIVAWLSSPMAIWIYVLVGLYILGVGALIIYDLIKNL